MKALLKIFFLFLFISIKVFSQDEDFNLIFKAEMIKNDGSDRLILTKNSSLENVIEGYFYLPQYEIRIEGEIKKGGFSFLDPNIFAVAYGMKKLRKAWVKNDFPVTDLEDLTNGVNLNKIFSFYIIPEMRNNDDNFITLFFKYAVYNRLNPETHIEPNQSYNVKLYSKKVKVPFGKNTSFNFIDEQFKDYHILFSIEKEENFAQYFDLKSTYKFFEGIKKSCEESLIRENVNLKISSEFLQLIGDKKYGQSGLWLDKYSSLKLRAKQSPLLKVKKLIDLRTKEEINFTNSIYTAKLTFPFEIYNSEKQKQYSSYKGSSKIFTSVYNIAVVPISIQNDSLTIDLFLDYSKINIDDIPRWTPIKKRIVIVKNEPVNIDLPKENWSANFSRNGNKYDIYGYADFEQYVNEFLILSFNSIEIKKGN